MSDVMMMYFATVCRIYYITLSNSFSHMCWKTWEGMDTKLHPLPTHKEN